MDFNLTVEQQMLQDSARRYGAEHHVFTAWRGRIARGEAFERKSWANMAELGWLALNVPEDLGGLDATPVETMVICEALGRHLMLEPFVSSCVIAPQLLRDAGPRATELLAAIGAGQAMVSVADAEPGGRFNLNHVATRAVATADGFTLDGVKSHVLDGGVADGFIIPARTSGAVGDAEGISLFLASADTPGLVVEPSRAMDNRVNARLRLEGVTLGQDALLGEVGQGAVRLARAIDAGVVARLAEALGAMEAAYEMTLSYLRTRSQFGQPIGAFQALQHRIVDMAIACEEARSMTYLATLSLSGAEPARSRTIAAAKARVSQTSLFVGRQAIQLHGGVGFTEELAIGHYLKRLIMIDMAFGNADHHRSRLAELSRQAA